MSDEQIIDAIKLLARTEGIFTEPAGGTTLAATIALVDQGAIPRDESVVLAITGNGYKTADAVADDLATPVQLGRTLKEFERYLESQPTEGPRKAPILN